MTRARCAILVGVLVCAGIFGCDKGGRKTGGDSALAEARQIYDSKCLTCHGASGRGDGMASASLPVKPRNYGDKEWQAKVDDATITKAIVEGGVAVGLNATMPPNPELKTKPEVVKELVKIIRDFGK